MSTGIAHMFFRGGGTLLPARSPYDRQILIEYVTDRVRTAGEVEVRLEGRHWIVRMHDRDHGSLCGGCGAAVHATCHAPADGPMAYCVTCAFGADEAPVTGRGEPWEQTG
jgi:hypothetical protein